VPDLYAAPNDPKRPRVGCDGRPHQLIREGQEVVPAAPGRPERPDTEYQRDGTCHLFMVARATSRIDPHNHGI
jgi:hypothetical protein